MVVLDLDKPTNEPAVLIDGTAYRLITFGNIPPLDHHRLLTAARRVDALLSQEQLSSDEEAELEVLPDRMCRLVLDAPDTVHGKLTSHQRAAVVQVFMTPSSPPSPTVASPAPAAVAEALS